MAVSAYLGATRGLSIERLRGPWTVELEEGFSSEKGASHRQRLGGTARQPVLPGESSRPELCAGQGQSHGVRIAEGRLQDSLSPSGDGLGGDSRPGCSSGGKISGGQDLRNKNRPRPKRITPWRQDYRKMPWSKPGPRRRCR